MRLVFITFLSLTIGLSFGQTVFVSGRVLDQNDEGAVFILLEVSGTGQKAQTDLDGAFKVGPFQQDTVITLSFKGNNIYAPFEQVVDLSEATTVDIRIDQTVNTLTTANIKDQAYREGKSEEVSVISTDMAKMKYMALPVPDMGSFIKTMAAVVSNSELSSSYSVRGGSFDENMVYVNDFPVYKPLITKSGQQEGLSFANTDLTQSLDFYAGGWSSNFGDKLSSVLDIRYKAPKKNAGSVNLGLLTNSAHVEIAGEKSYFLFGTRYKNTQYLLNTLETEGEYLPRFVDFQGLYHYNLDSTSSIEVLAGFASNHYTVIPATRETSFGTSAQILQLTMGFEGQEQLKFNTLQGGVKYTKQFNERHRAKIILSGVHSVEKEFKDIEGGYRLCDADTDLEEDNRREECITERGVGSIFDHARNTLTVDVVDLQYRGYYASSDTSKFMHEYGFELASENMTDVIDEYSFEDSSNYVVNLQSVDNTLQLNAIRSSLYYQSKYQISDSASVTIGSRAGYWSPSNSFFVSPRLRYSKKTSNKKGDKIINKFALGVYHQPPFYRELRSLEGTINTNLKPQVSYQAVVGRDRLLDLFGRPFKLTYELYGKYLDNVIPYEIDDLKIRYYGHNDAHAYVVGGEFRLSGELIHGEESWINIGVLTTQEDIEGDEYGYIRRPTDQRLTVSTFIQDHLPNNPLMKVNLNLIFGSGLPFAPLNEYQVRDETNTPFYRRVDLGFSRIIVMKDRKVKKKSLIETIWISLDILNLLGVSNTISYIWIEDYNGANYAVPNTLSQRFVNLKVHVNF